MTSNAEAKRASISEASRHMAEDRAKAALDERDEKSVLKLLSDAGVKSYEPRVVSQLVERVRRYTAEILGDARDYADHAGRVDIAMDDVRLAVRKKQDALSCGPPAIEDLIRQADEVNRIPLPPVPDVFGVRLPPPQYQTTLPNLQWDVEEDPLPTQESEAIVMAADHSQAQGNRNKRKVKAAPKLSATKAFALTEKRTQGEENRLKAENKAARRRAQLAQQAGGI